MAPATKATTVRARLPADQRRALIVESAATSFASRGYEGTTLDDVALAAGVTKPILYRHFASKQNLYMALLIKHAADLPGFVSELPRDSEGGLDLRAVLDPWFSYARTHPHGWQMLFRDAGGDEEIVAFRRQVRERARAVVAGFVERAGGGGSAELDPEELEAVAEMIRAGLAGLVLWWGEHPDAPQDAVVSAAVRLLQPLFSST